MRRRVLEVDLDGYGSLVRGYGSRELIVELTGRAPVWSNIHRGWSVQEKTARDVIAAAEVRNFDVLIAGPRAHVSHMTHLKTPEPAAGGNSVTTSQDPGRGLW